jgi:hypothetical protein
MALGDFAPAVDCAPLCLLQRQVSGYPVWVAAERLRNNQDQLAPGGLGASRRVFTYLAAGRALDIRTAKGVQYLVLRRSAWFRTEPRRTRARGASLTD